MVSRTTTVKLDKKLVYRTERIRQYAYGQILLFEGVDLPEAYEVNFSNEDFDGEAKTQIGTADGVEIPDEYLETGENVYVWVVLHETESDGRAVYKAVVPVEKRSKPIDAEPTPVQQDVITQAIAVLQSAVAETSASAESASASAESASESAESASASAESALASAESATASAESAGSSAESASASAESASASAESASESADSAETSAERAEQAASQSGYMFFEIVNGDLIYQRTENVTVDFYLADGDLYLTEDIA